MSERYIMDGEVAVLICGNGGWSSCSDDPVIAARMLFDPDIVKALLAGDFEAGLKIARAKYPGEHFNDDVEVEWVEAGERFIVTNNAIGGEMLCKLSELNIFTA